MKLQLVSCVIPFMLERLRHLSNILQNFLELMPKMLYNLSLMEYRSGGATILKDLRLLVWITQLGISVAAPLGGFVLVAVWLYRQFGWGVWILVVGILLGLAAAADGLRTSLKAMKKMSEDKKDDPPPVSFNEHD